MKISIVTATYNSEKTLEETIISVLTQTHQDFEHIIIDGLSKDNTLDIVKKYELQYNGRLKLISEKDKGLYDAMNKGLQMAAGDIIGILNSDDKLADENTLSIINEQLENSDYDGVYSDLLFMDYETMSIPVRKWISKTGNIKFGWHPPHPTLYLKKEVYKENGYFNLKYRIAADYDFMIRIIKNNTKLAYIKKYLVHMRAGGVSTDGIKGYYRNFKEANTVLKDNKIKFAFLINSKRTLKTFKQMLIAKFK